MIDVLVARALVALDPVGLLDQAPEVLSRLDFDESQAGVLLDEILRREMNLRLVYITRLAEHRDLPPLPFVGVFEDVNPLSERHFPRRRRLLIRSGAQVQTFFPHEGHPGCRSLRRIVRRPLDLRDPRPGCRGPGRRSQHRLPEGLLRRKTAGAVLGGARLPLGGAPGIGDLETAVGVGKPSLVILHGVRQLMDEEPFARRSIGGELIAAEIEVVAEGEGPRTEGGRRTRGLSLADASATYAANCRGASAPTTTMLQLWTATTPIRRTYTRSPPG